MNENLIHALNKLNELLKASSTRLSLTVCGAFALYLLGYQRVHQTEDIDTHEELNSQVKKLIKDISIEFELQEKWLNDQISDIQLPIGAEKRFVHLDRWSQIDCKILSRIDLIAMKASAWISRRDITDKDYNDLVLLEPIKAEIEFAIEHAETFNSPDRNLKKNYQEFLESVDELRKLAK